MLKNINQYLLNQLNARLAFMPDTIRTKMLQEAELMNVIGVSSQEDHKIFAYIKQHARKAIEDITNEKVDVETLAKVSSLVFDNRNINKINSVNNFYIAVRASLQELGFKKLAYPIAGGNIAVSPQHNLGKWMQGMRDIYVYMQRGISFNEAFDIITTNWDVMEKNDFKYWMRFYQEGAHEKYKTAATEYYQLNGDGPPMIPISHLKAQIPGVSVPGMPSMNIYDQNKEIEKELTELEKEKRKREEELRRSEIRKKIISRLQAAEKIVTDPDIQGDLNEAIDMGLGKWLETLHSLKRSIQTAPMRHSASTIFIDLIIRQGNKLKSEGFPKSGNFLIKLAQESSVEPPKAPPVEELEESENIPADLLEPPREEEGGNEAMREFVRRMNNEYIDNNDSQDENDSLAITAQEVISNEDPLLPPENLPEIEVTEPPVRMDLESDLLKNVTIKDVVDRLELVANILRKREIPRQLSFVDLMMDQLGIVGFFPTLAEAHRSALEANQYMSTRIDDIISKLRGSLEPAATLELTTTPKENIDVTETLEQVRENLQRFEDTERKQKDKKRSQREAEEKLEEADMATKELSGPVEVRRAPPIRAIR